VRGGDGLGFSASGTSGAVRCLLGAPPEAALPALPRVLRGRAGGAGRRRRHGDRQAP
jgi:hypothetical protein